MTEIKLSTWQDHSSHPESIKWLTENGSWLARVNGAWCNDADLICRGHTEAEAVYKVLDELQDMYTAIGAFLGGYKRGPCGMRHHAADCDCGRVAGDR